MIAFRTRYVPVESEEAEEFDSVPVAQRLPTMYWKEHQVAHVGIVHWNDDHGNAVVRALNEIAAEHYPELTVVAADIPSLGATPQDYADAVDILARTKYRWFYASVSADDVIALTEEAVRRGIAGTGEHVWMFYGSILSSFIGMTVENNSILLF